jgi:hypothetical protein
MYFTYTVQPQNFVRTLTQGVSLPDNQILAGGYKRIAEQTVQADATPTRLVAFYKTIHDTLSGIGIAQKEISIFKRIQETLGGFDSNSRSLSIFAGIKDTLRNFGLSKGSFFHLRNIYETINATETASHLRNIFRGLVDLAGTESEAKTGWLHFRALSETATAISSVSRGLFLFARIVSGLFIRDRLLGRFLKSKAELALKSCVSREITLESNIVDK